MKWRPIKIAPKDGTKILVGYDLLNDPEIWVSWWIDGDDRWANTPSWIGFSPSHWMPLPDPPEPERFDEYGFYGENNGPV